MKICVLTLPVLMMACTPIDIDVSALDTSTAIPMEEIPPEEEDPTSNECSQDYDCNIQQDEICFKGTCNNVRALVYEVRFLEYKRFGVACADFIYEAKLDGKEVYESSVSECGGAWPKESFEMNGDQILDIGVWEVGALGKKKNGMQACIWTYKQCQQFPVEFLKAQKIEYASKVFSVKMSIVPVKSLLLKL